MRSALLALIAVPLVGPIAAPHPAAAKATPAHPAAAAAKPDLKTHRSAYGRILTDDRGRALYLFTRDHGAKSRCYGACADAWPPYVVHGDPTAAPGLDQAKLGTTNRRGGDTQLTYAGHPLYFYVGDRKAGQVLCQNVVEFGGTWLVVSPEGKAIR
jgi:predicted lipoprotein with Yx(FWY)xxD motif